MVALEEAGACSGCRSRFKMISWQTGFKPKNGLQEKSEMQGNWKVLYEKFVETVCDTGAVWLLVSEQGYAQCASERFADADVIPMYSSEIMAAAAASAIDEGYKPERVSLDELLEDWLPGMDEDGVWVGVDWGEDWSGLEIEALQLLDDLLEMQASNP